MQVALDCSLLNLKTDTESQQLEVASPPPPPLQAVGAVMVSRLQRDVVELLHWKRPACWPACPPFLSASYEDLFFLFFWGGFFLVHLLLFNNLLGACRQRARQLSRTQILAG